MGKADQTTSGARDKQWYRQSVIEKKQAKHCDEYAAAEFLGLSVATLRDWRFRRIGPAYCKFGKAVRYPIRELERFAEAATVIDHIKALKRGGADDSSNMQWQTREEAKAKDRTE